MSVIAVGKAIQRMNDHKVLHSEEAVNLAINEMVLKRVENVDKVIMSAMGAKVVGSEKRGRVGKERWTVTSRPDHATQLKAVDTIKSFIETIRPKGGGVNIALQQNNNAGESAGISPAKSFDFEARLRTIRERKGLASESSEFVDAEYEDGSTDELADELAEIGIELDEEEGEGDDE